MCTFAANCALTEEHMHDGVVVPTAVFGFDPIAVCSRCGQTGWHICPEDHGVQYKPIPSGTTTNEVRVTSATGGEKGSKEARFDLIPVGPLTQLARLYGRGAAKYAARNWERGYDWSLSYAAAQRHMTQFWAGEDVDEEMGLPHPIAAIFHMMALAQFLEQHPDFDDRPGRV